MLVADAAGRDAGRPMRDPRHANAAFGQVHLAAHQRPVVAEALAAVVAGEDDQRVVQLPGFLQRIDDPANAFVHVVDHALVGVDVAAVQVKQVVFDLGCLRMVFARFPRPVRRGVVQAQKEGVGGALALPHALDKVDRLAGNQVGQIAFMRLFLFTHPQIVRAAGGAVGKVVHATGHGAKELVIP